MPKEIIMPNLGASSVESKLVKWNVKDGDKVTKHQVVFEAESDKAMIEIEASDSGIFKKREEEGSLVSSGQIVGYIYKEGEEIFSKEEKTSDEERNPFMRIATEKTNPISRLKTDRLFVSPLARRIARDNTVDLTKVKGTGPNGRIICADIEKKVADQKIEVENIQSEPISSIRAKIAEKMQRSHLTTVPSTIHSEVSADELIMLKEKLNQLENIDVKIQYDLIIAIICAEALKHHPLIMSQLHEKEIVKKVDINIGIAVDTPKGLMVPVIKNIDHKSLKSLAVELNGLVARIKDGKGTVDDFSGGVFTISNLGRYRVSSFTPIINYPESAILGIGKIIKKPVVRNDRIEIGNVMTLSFTYDHRLIDGAPAARFLQMVGDFIESPVLMIFEKEV